MYFAKVAYVPVQALDRRYPSTNDTPIQRHHFLASKASDSLAMNSTKASPKLSS